MDGVNGLYGGLLTDGRLPTSRFPKRHSPLETPQGRKQRASRRLRLSTAARILLVCATVSDMCMSDGEVLRSVALHLTMYLIFETHGNANSGLVQRLGSTSSRDEQRNTGDCFWPNEDALSPRDVGPWDCDVTRQALCHHSCVLLPSIQISRMGEVTPLFN